MKIHEGIAVSAAPFVSFEFFPPKERSAWEDFFAVVRELKGARPLFASVTYGAGGFSQDATLEIAECLQHTVGIETMPHLTCVGATAEIITDFLKRLRALGITNVLALRGDAPKTPGFSWKDGEFRSALDLVRFIRSRAPDIAIGVAGYPAVHPDAATVAEGLDYMRQKIEAGADFIVTQLFFDYREYIEYVSRLHGLGVNVPVLPGVLPIQSLGSVRRILSMCGANIPGKLYLDLETAHEQGKTAAVREAGIAFAIRQCRALLENGAPGVHLYTLNRADMCLRIAGHSGLI